VLRYAIAAGAIGVALLFREAPFLALLSAVMAAAWFGGAGPGLAASVLAAIATYLLYPPPLADVSPLAHGLRVGVLLVEGLLISMLIPALRTARRIAETSRKEALRHRETLRQSEQRYLTVAETASDAFVTFDAQGTILLVNRAAEKIFGYSVQQMTGQNISLLIPGFTPQRLAPAAQEAARQEQKPSEWAGRHRTGDSIPVEISFAEHGTRTSQTFTGIMRDVTDRKRAEEERAHLLIREKQARQQAEAANRGKDQFLAVLSHELRTPLNAILGWAHMLRSGKLDPKSALRGFDAIERNARVQAAIINDILDVSRIIAGKFSIEKNPVDLPAVIEAAVDAIRPAAESKRIIVDCRLNRTSTAFDGDAQRLQQAVSNLLSNAVKFTPEGGRVTVLHEVLDSGVRIRVSDTGAGIPAGFLPHVFDRFRQGNISVENAKHGLGLGLAIVEHVVKLHGGSVKAESRGEGQGASFTVSLPLIRERTGERPVGSARQAEEISSPGSSQLSETLRGIRVLVVDDEADARELLKTVLEMKGASVTAVDSAPEALKELQRFQPHVLLSDIAMPGEDGYSLIRKIRGLVPEKISGIPAAAVTAYARDEDRRKSFSAGFQIHLAKPVDPAEIVSTVAHLAGRQ
jgi:PAS domain S-box-containing protein